MQMFSDGLVPRHSWAFFLTLTSVLYASSSLLHWEQWLLPKMTHLARSICLN